MIKTKYENFFYVSKFLLHPLKASPSFRNDFLNFSFVPAQVRKIEIEKIKNLQIPIRFVQNRQRQFDVVDIRRRLKIRQNFLPGHFRKIVHRYRLVQIGRFPI